ncbi:MAG: hypothetical protein ED555_11300 [Allomuricauda sp.]|nr:MAG: hypothetical protein ED555_11300 [Allomuricauda sp.]
MKKLILLSLISLFLTNANLNGQNLDLFDNVGSEAVDKLEGNLRRLMIDASNNADIILMQRLDQIEIVLNNLKYGFARELNRQVRNMDLALRNTILDLDSFLDNTYVELRLLVQDLDLIINNTLENFCLNLGNLLCPDKKITRLIQGVDNINQQFSDNANFYSIQAYGTALNTQDSNYEIYLEFNGKKYEWDVPTRAGKTNRVQFNIPSNIINPMFLDTLPVRKNCKIVVTRKKKKKFFGLINPKKVDTVSNLRTAIYLLPKYPLKYELTEYRKEEEWVSNPEYVKPVLIKSTGTNYLSTFSIDFAEDEQFEKIIEISPGSINQDVGSNRFFFACNKERLIKAGKRVEIDCINCYFSHDKAARTELANFAMAFENKKSLKRDDLFTIKRNVIVLGVPVWLRMGHTPQDVRIRVKYKKLIRNDSIITEKKLFIPNPKSDHLVREGYLRFGITLSDFLVSQESDYRIELWPSWGNYRSRKVIIDSNSNTFYNIENLAKVRSIESILLDEKQVKIEIQPLR